MRDPHDLRTSSNSRKESYLAVLKFNFIKKRVHKRVQRTLLLGAKKFYTVLVKMTQMSQNDFEMTQMDL